MVSLNDLEVNKGHFESQAIVAYIIVKYRNSVFNDENGILKENDLMVTSNNNNCYQALTCAGAAGKIDCLMRVDIMREFSPSANKIEKVDGQERAVHNVY